MPKASKNQRFITVTNKVNNSKIRVETYRGDEIIVIPSYMHPGDIVMNDIMYPEEESRLAAPSFSGVPVPFGHPEDEDGNFVSASSEIGINYYSFGAFNGNASYDENSKRIYAEVRINKRIAAESENGRRVLAAIEAGEPISTSTGLFVDIEELDEPLTNSTGQKYKMIARNLVPDHNAILLDEEPAANVETGTGMMINGKRVEFAGNLDDSMRELESRLYDAVREEFSDPTQMLHAWVADWNHEELVYEVGGDNYQIRWQESEDSGIQFIGESRPVKRKTLWEAIKNYLFAPSGKTSYNQGQHGHGGRVLETINRGDDMSFRQNFIDKLKANKVELDYETVTDEQLLEAVETQTATNQAETEQETATVGEETANDAVVAAINSALKPLTDKVEALETALNAEKETELAEMRKKLNADGDYEDGEVDDMGEKAVRAAYKRMTSNSSQPAYHVGGANSFRQNQAEGCTSLDLPSVEVE